jgi:hypothetical protein
MTPSQNLGDRAASEQARDFLAPLYGGSAVLSPRDAAEFEAVRDLVTDYLAQPLATDRLRNAVLDRVSRWPSRPAVVTPLGGAILLHRSGAQHALPHDRSIEADPGDLVVVPTGCRAEVQLADGTSLLLASGTRLRLGGLDENRERARLIAGRVFAWVARQVRGGFVLGTPQGEVFVLGTEFDVTAEANGRLRLLVAKGKVGFTRTGADRPVAPALTRGQLLQLEDGRAAMRTLTRRETLEETRWAQAHAVETGSAPAWRRWLFGGLAAAAIGSATWMMMPPTHEDHVAPALGHRVDGRPFVMAPVPEEGLRLHVVSDTRMEEAGGIPARFKTELVSERSAPDAEGWRTVTRRICQREILRPDGTPLETGTTSAASAAFSYRTDGQGRADRVEVPGGGKPTPAQLKQVLDFLISDMILTNAPGEVRQGQTWSFRREDRFNLDPETHWRLEVEYTFRGFELMDGREVARVDYVAHSRIRGGLLGTQVTEVFERKFLRLETKSTQRGSMFLDAATSVLARLEEQSEVTERTRMLTSVKGGEPLRQDSTSHRRTQSTINVERLP